MIGARAAWGAWRRLVVMGWLLLAAPAFAQDARLQTDARNWLDDMGEAVERLSYRGTFMHTVSNDHQQTLQVVHRYQGGRISERLISMDGPGREIIRTDDEVRCILQDRKSVLVDTLEDQSPLRDALPSYTRELDRYYDFVFDHRGKRIANRSTVRVSVRPKDDRRFGYELWLDAKNSMPLRCELVSPDGKVIEAIQFTEIKYVKQIPDSEFKATLVAEDFERIQRSPPSPSMSVARAPIWQARRVPTGFRLQVATRKPLGDREVEHLVYTDGLAAVSVFVEPLEANADAPLEGLSSIGPAQAYGHQVGNFQITVLGEVPAVTVEMIARSVQQRPGR